MSLRRLITTAAAAVFALGIAGTATASAQVSPPTSAALRAAPVHAPAPRQSAATMPRTGSDVVPAALAGVGLAGAGAAMVVAARRRTTAV